MSDLLTPATDALLDGWCGRVDAGRWPDDHMVWDGYEEVFFVFGEFEMCLSRSDVPDAALDLQYASVRDRCRRVAAVKLGLDPERTRLGVVYHSVGHVGVTFGDDKRTTDWQLPIDGEKAEGRKLPDGSSWLEALALKVTIETLCGEQ